MNKQEALVKLATVRCAINHVLRTRAMQKQAERPLFDFRGLWDPAYQRRWSRLDPANAGTLAGATYDKDMRMMRIKEPENGQWNHPLRTPWWGLGLPEAQDILDTSARIKRMQQRRDPAEIEKNKKSEGPH